MNEYYVCEDRSDYIMHYGRKGMKWGKHKFQTKEELGRLAEAAQRNMEQNQRDSRIADTYYYSHGGSIGRDTRSDGSWEQNMREYANQRGLSALYKSGEEWSRRNQLADRARSQYHIANANRRISENHRRDHVNTLTNKMRADDSRRIAEMHRTKPPKKTRNFSISSLASKASKSLNRGRKFVTSLFD